jgi:hypothetical protein
MASRVFLDAPMAMNLSAVAATSRNFAIMSVLDQ